MIRKSVNQTIFWDDWTSIGEIWGSDNSADGDARLLRCDAVSIGKYLFVLCSLNPKHGGYKPLKKNQ